jgi:RimJ/RimL family protein N-acetyltransferase
MLTDHYAAYGIRLRTPRLELRLPDLDDLAALADVAIEGVHDPEEMPFLVPWTDAQPAVRGRSVITHHLGVLASATAANWHLPFCVVFDGAPIGIQDISARDFAVLREVETGSWIGQRYQGKGLGTEMRAAVLHLAFEGLGAVEAISAARNTNVASNSVSRKLGYAPDGLERWAVRGELTIHSRFRLERTAWSAHRTVPVTVEGLSQACLADLGAIAPGDSSGSDSGS